MATSYATEKTYPLYPQSPASMRRPPSPLTYNPIAGIREEESRRKALEQVKVQQFGKYYDSLTPEQLDQFTPKNLPKMSPMTIGDETRTEATNISGITREAARRAFERNVLPNLDEYKMSQAAYERAKSARQGMRDVAIDESNLATRELEAQNIELKRAMDMARLRQIEANTANAANRTQELEARRQHELKLAQTRATGQMVNSAIQGIGRAAGAVWNYATKPRPVEKQPTQAELDREANTRFVQATRDFDARKKREAAEMVVAAGTRAGKPAMTQTEAEVKWEQQNKDKRPKRSDFIAKPGTPAPAVVQNPIIEKDGKRMVFQNGEWVPLPPNVNPPVSGNAASMPW